MPRVTSEFFIAQLMRRTVAEGGFATLVKKGSSEAGAIYILVRTRDGALNFFGPAAQHIYSAQGTSERYFSRVDNVTSDSDVSAFLIKEERFDPDFWVVELETDLTLSAPLFEVMTQ